MIGQVLSGSYRLTDLVGSGGYADVYLARDLRSNTIVAVKILHAHVARDPDVAARFEREASLARGLQTPHVARVLDAGQDSTSPPFMAMEFVQGLTVAELIRRHGPFPIPEALHIVDQLLSALGSAHALGIVHRDVKPQNMMIDAERRLKVLDFGVARVVGAGTMTASGHPLGTPEYMASEQVEGQPVDHRADLYAAGAVLYQLLSGRPPYLRFADTDLWELIRRVRTEPPPSIRQLRPEVPAPIVAVIERAMTKDPAQRFQSAYEMRQALASAAGTAPPTPQPPPITAPSPGVTQILDVPPVLVPPEQSPPGQFPSGQALTRPYMQGVSPLAQPTPGYAPPRTPPPGPYPPGQYPPMPGPPRGGTLPPPPPGAGRAMPPVPSPGPGPGPGQRRSGMPAWQIVGLGVGALVLVIVGVAVGRMVPLPGRSTPTPTTVAVSTPTPAATAVPPTSTQAAAAKVSSPVAAGTSQAASAPSPSPVVAVKPTSPPPKPTSPPPSPTVPPKPTNPPGVLVADDFERAEIGQLPRTSSRPNDYVFSFDRGEYVINKINAALQIAPMVILNGPYDNTVISIDVRLMGDVSSRYGFVVCRNQPAAQSKHYRASIAPDGRRLILSRWDDGQERMLATVRDEPAINPGNAKNRVELRCAGTRISAAVNGKVVASVTDMTLSRGDHGVGAGAFSGTQGTIEARYDNLEIRSP